MEELEFQEAIAERYKALYEKRINQTKQERALYIAQKMLLTGMDV